MDLLSTKSMEVDQIMDWKTSCMTLKAEQQLYNLKMPYIYQQKQKFSFTYDNHQKHFHPVKRTSGQLWEIVPSKDDGEHNWSYL